MRSAGTPTPVAPPAWESLNEKPRPIAASVPGSKPFADVPDGGVAIGAEVVDQRAEERERAVAVVHDLEQARLDRPVALGRGLDPPEASAAGTPERGDLVLVRVAGDVRDDVRMGEQERLQVGADVDRARAARVAIAAGVDPVAVRVVQQARQCELVGQREPQGPDRVVAEQDDQLVARLGSSDLALDPAELRVVDVPLGRRAGDSGLLHRVDRDEA